MDDKKKEMSENKIVNMLIRASVESASQPPIKTPFFTLRSQFHILIVMPFGTGKSSLAGHIPNSHTTLNYTLPAVVGTINKEGDYINSAVVNSANGVFIIDEGHRLTQGCINALLSLLEQGYYSRMLGYKIKNPKNDGDLSKLGWEVRPNNTGNGFDLWADFSCIWFGERIYEQHKGAFLSRFFPLMIAPKRNDVNDYLMGEEFLSCDVKGKYKKYKNNCIMDKPTFIYLTKNFITKTDNFYFSDAEQGYRVRGRGQLIKLAGHFARLRGSLKINKQDCDRALLFADICMLNYQVVNLNPLEMKIFNLIRLGNMKQEEIAGMLNITQPVVSEYIAKLREKHIILK
ncbi:MAG: winged helix-turn-helix transcriptional regulator [Sideroxydans sp.]|nr:winged helix-turn-helix transcriptional regulator [Sideroxydans sp.]